MGCEDAGSAVLRGRGWAGGRGEGGRQGAGLALGSVGLGVRGQGCGRRMGARGMAVQGRPRACNRRGTQERMCAC